MSDYYKTLGVERGVGQEEIKRAYRKLAHQFHPDKQNGDEKKFKEINEAYQILSDPKKRAHYDQFGSSFGQGFGGHNQSGSFDGFDFSQFGGFGRDFEFQDVFEVFGDLFGQRGPRRSSAQANRGNDLELRLNISFAEMARGVEKKIELNKDMTCPECNASGAKKGTSLIECSVCSGRGEVKETMGAFLGNFTRIYTCNACLGKGKVPKENCPNCLGEGRRKSKINFEIKIPAGVRDGETLVIRNGGQTGFRGGPSGDLYLKITIDSDKRFKRVGEDIIYELQIKLTDALLGKKIAVPTLGGEKEIEIPAGIEEGAELKLKGYGIRGRRHGDQIIKIKIQLPKKLNSKAKKLVEELAREEV